MGKDIAGYISFDLDGCLWDSDLSHYLAVNEALKPFGEYISEEEHLSTFKGLPTARKCEMLTQMGRLPRSTHQEVAQLKREATLIAIKETVKPRPEVTATLVALKEAGWKLCCCSNSIRATVQDVLLRMQILRFFDFYLSNEDVEKAKPAADMFLKAARLYCIPPTELVAIEDANAGKRAVLSAGCKLISIDGPHDVEPNLIHRVLAEGRNIARMKQSNFSYCNCTAVGAI